MGRKSATVEKIDQRLDEDLRGDVKQFPSQIPRFFTNNLITRTFAYLFGFDSADKPKKIRVTDLGDIRIASGSELFDTLTVYEGITDVAGITLPFPNGVRFIEIWVKNNDARVRLTPIKGLETQIFAVYEGYYPISMIVKSVWIGRSGAAPDIQYQVLGWA